MKAVFALFGLFMFASISSTEVVANNTLDNDQPELTENAEGAAVGGGRRVLVIQY